MIQEIKLFRIPSNITNTQTAEENAEASETSESNQIFLFSKTLRCPKSNAEYLFTS